MATTIKTNFETRRETEMAVERLVQEFGIERTDIFITTEGDFADGDSATAIDGAHASPRVAAVLNETGRPFLMGLRRFKNAQFRSCLGAIEQLPIARFEWLKPSHLLNRANS